MKEALVKLFKQIEIDSESEVEHAKTFHENSFKELKVAFNFAQHPYTTWDQLKRNIPDSIIPIENKVKQSVLHLTYSLRGKVPNQFLDCSGSIDIPFKEIEFRILDSDMENITNHRIQLKFITDYLTLVDSFENKLLLSYGDKSYALKNGDELSTFFVEMDSTVGINGYKKLKDYN